MNISSDFRIIDSPLFLQMEIRGDESEEEISQKGLVLQSTQELFCGELESDIWLDILQDCGISPDAVLLASQQIIEGQKLYVPDFGIRE